MEFSNFTNTKILLLVFEYLKISSINGKVQKKGRHIYVFCFALIVSLGRQESAGVRRIVR